MKTKRALTNCISRMPRTPRFQNKPVQEAPVKVTTTWRLRERQRWPCVAVDVDRTCSRYEGNGEPGGKKRTELGAKWAYAFLTRRGRKTQHLGADWQVHSAPLFRSAHTPGIAGLIRRLPRNSRHRFVTNR